VASDSLVGILGAWPGIRHVQAFATKPGILKTETDFQGVILKGVDAGFDWTFFRNNLKEGAVFTLSPEETSSEALISRYLANLLRLKTGDSFYTYFVQDDVRARRFHITGIYETGFEDYDKLFVLTDIRQIRRLNGWDEDEASGLEVLVEDYEAIDEITNDLFFELADTPDRKGNSLYVRSVKELNPMIFAWLDVLDTNVVVIIFLMLAVAGFTMISGLLVIILERIRMIGILKALGQANASIRKVFLYLSFFLIGRGMLWGNVVGIAVCLIQSYAQVFRLDPAIYYLEAVPVDLSLGALLLLNVCTMAASMCMMLAPSRMVASIKPAKSIRYE
jgi:lipoprotein-releasing system permease protein